MQNSLNPYAKQSDRVRSMFDKISALYDLTNRVLSLWQDVPWRKIVSKKLNGSTKVLDLCCGTGDLTFAVSNSSNMVVGVDFSGRMLKKANIKSDKQNGKTFFIQADALRLPFKSSAFDSATIAFGIRNLSDFYVGINEMSRVVKGEGSLCILEFSKPQSRIVRALYKLYLSRVVPVIGWFITGTDAYYYLFRTIDLWPDETSFRKLLVDAGFNVPEAHKLTCGIATLYILRK